MSVEHVFTSMKFRFRVFAEDTPTVDLVVSGVPCEQDPTCLADYVEAWLVSGHGVRACQANYERFLIAFAAIVDEWLRNPDDLLDYLEEVDVQDIRRHPRSVSKLFQDGEQECRVLDRDFFDWRVFITMHGSDFV